MCVMCNGYGVITAYTNNEEYAYKCKCNAGNNEHNSKLENVGNRELKYPSVINLSENENAMYERFKNKGKIDICPF